MIDDADDLRDLLDRLRGGDPEALAELFARHEDRLRRMIDFRLDAEGEFPPKIARTIGRTGGLGTLER